MDLLVSNVIYSQLKTKKKGEEDFQTSTTGSTGSGSTGAVLIINMVGIIIGFFAAYLSWSCNTAEGINTGLKIVYSFFAFLFGLLYLIFYAIFRAGKCYPPPQIVYVPQQQTQPVSGGKGRSSRC